MRDLPPPSPISSLKHYFGSTFSFPFRESDVVCIGRLSGLYLAPRIGWDPRSQKRLPMLSYLWVREQPEVVDKLPVVLVAPESHSALTSGLGDVVVSVAVDNAGVAIAHDRYCNRIDAVVAHRHRVPIVFGEELRQISRCACIEVLPRATGIAIVGHEFHLGPAIAVSVRIREEVQVETPVRTATEEELDVSVRERLIRPVGRPDLRHIELSGERRVVSVLRTTQKRHTGGCRKA